LKKIYFSSHKLPKQQSTNFWFQGILGVNLITMNKILRLCIPKQKIHRITCTDIGAFMVESAFKKKSKLWEMKHFKPKHHFGIGISSHT
jgi:hypothetical protein